MHLFLRGPQSRWLAVFAVTIVMLGIGGAVGWFRSDTPSRPTHADVWRGLTGPNKASVGHPSGESSALAPSLAELLPGLEAKAAANPADVGTQILLAQTYSELDRPVDGLRVLERLARGNPKDGEIAFARANLLSQGEGPKELREAFELYARAATLAPRLTPLARLHQGEIRTRLGDRAGAVRIWQDHLARFPDDSHRALFEAAIAQVRAPAAGG